MHKETAMKIGFAVFVLLFAANIHAEEPDTETIRMLREIVRCGGYHIGFANHMAANPLSPDNLEAAENGRNVGRLYLFLAHHLMTLNSDYTMAEAERRWKELQDDSVRLGALIIDHDGNATRLIGNDCKTKFGDMAAKAYPLWLEQEGD